MIYRSIDQAKYDSVSKDSNDISQIKEQIKTNFRSRVCIFKMELFQ